jgi:hypothetical protein
MHLLYAFALAAAVESSTVAPSQPWPVAGVEAARTDGDCDGEPDLFDTADDDLCVDIGEIDSGDGDWALYGRGCAVGGVGAVGWPLVLFGLAVRSRRVNSVFPRRTSERD